MTDKSEPFAAIPNRFIDAADVNGHQFFLGAVLIARANYLNRTVTGTLDEIEGWCRGRLKGDHLSKQLRAMRRNGWIEYEPPRGPGATYRIKLTGLVLGRVSAESPVPATPDAASDPGTSANGDGRVSAESRS
jgi:hypothetical protein